MLLTPTDERTSALLAPFATDLNALSARASLRIQIARMERRLGVLAVELGASGRALPLPPGVPIRSPGSSTRVRPSAGPSGGPRLLTLGELEVVRDELVSRVRAAERALERCVGAEARTRTRLEAMLADPNAHRFEIIHRTELGEPGCGAYQVRPRLGLLGVLFGWWCVKLSSGCPLSMADHDRRPRRRAGRNATLELVMTVVVVVGMLSLFLLVYHDVPLRGR